MNKSFRFDGLVIVGVRMHPPERVLGWGPCAGVGGDSQWVCWRAEEDGGSPSGEYGWTEELREEEG